VKEHRGPVCGGRCQARGRHGPYLGGGRRDRRRRRVRPARDLGGYAGVPFIPFLIFLNLLIAFNWLVFTAIAAFRASRGLFITYPFTIRWGAQRRRDRTA
jgi:hypothetical protein